MISSIITAHGYKPHKLLPSFASALASGADEIIITLTGVTEKEVRTIRRKCLGAKIVTNPTNYSNEQWIRGLSAATNPFVHLLHDGDILTPDIFSDLSLDADVTIFQASNQQGPQWIHKELCYPGINKDDVLRFLGRYGYKTVSPGKGIWKRDVLLNSLQNFEAITSPSLISHGSLVIGNDLYCWLCGPKTFGAVQKVLVSYDTLDSTTVRGDADKWRNLSRFYDEVRDRLDLWDLDSKPSSLLRTLYTRDVSPSLLASFNLLPGDKFVYSKLLHPEQETKDLNATNSWLTALEYAHFMGYDFFQYFEGDCWINPELASSYHVSTSGLQHGAPIVWGPHNLGRRFYDRYINFQKSNHHIPLLEGANAPAQTSVYCNGALCVYNTEFHFEQMYPRGIVNLVSISPFDLVSGYILVDIFREKVFYKITCDSRIYSDCGDHQITPAKRRELKKTLTAIHKDIQ